MKGTLTTLIEEMNQSEEIKEEQITKILSCFQDADTRSETQLLVETRQWPESLPMNGSKCLTGALSPPVWQSC
jgi:hypothetical protein